jgi:hypothetical protein
MRFARTAILQGSVSVAALIAGALAGAQSASAAGPGVVPRASCASLTGLTLPKTQILSASQKTGYCNVIGIINKRVSSQDPDHFTYGVGFALNLPDTWFGRFEMMGGGGTDGRLNADPQGSANIELGQGWAVAATDGGHEDSPANPVGEYQDDDPNAGGAHISASTTRRASTMATTPLRRRRASPSRSLPTTTDTGSTSPTSWAVRTAGATAWWPRRSSPICSMA